MRGLMAWSQNDSSRRLSTNPSEPQGRLNRGSRFGDLSNGGDSYLVVLKPFNRLRFEPSLEKTHCTEALPRVGVLAPRPFSRFFASLGDDCVVSVDDLDADDLLDKVQRDNAVTFLIEDAWNSVRVSRAHFESVSPSSSRSRKYRFMF